MIGVAISTHNRRDVLDTAVSHWRKHLPDGATLIVVDDASTVPAHVDGVDVVRQSVNLGVAMTKNRCIAELVDRGCSHLFLADDDVWPVSDDWWKPYVESPHEHLSYQWERTGRNPGKWVKTWEDETHWAIGFPRGVLLYVTRKVIDRVGGNDVAYGVHGGEHVEWQQRIYDAGFGPAPFMDAKESGRHWYSKDEERGGVVGSTIPLAERKKLADRNGLLWGKRTTEYREYRGGVKHIQDYSLGVQLSDRPEGVLDHVLSQHPFGVALEFGVGEGHSLRRIAKKLFAYGFDTWRGLPEKWRDGFDQGMFACQQPRVANTHLVEGLVQDTIQHFDFGQAGPIGLVHLDLDLYSSTAAVLEGVEQRSLTSDVFRSGTYVVFDEWHGYPHDGATGPEDHEQKAWREFADRTGISWSVIGHGPEQWAIRIM